MTFALILTALTSLAIASYPPFLEALVSNRLGIWIILILELILVAYLSRRIMVMSTAAAYLGFIVYSVVNGVTLSLIFLAYEIASIYQVFFVSAGLFLLTSVVGYFIKADLSGVGRFLMMCLFGMILVFLVNIFLSSSTLDYLISAAGVLIFSGLTAYDVQTLKKMYQSFPMSEEDSRRIAILGALRLYLDFINLFLWLLRLVGKRR
jgi:FtsH-binding integral membrane protein